MAARTVLEYKALMKHAIGNADPATGVTLLSMLNDALRELFDFHDWSWRKRPVASLSFVGSQTYVALPSDFGHGELIAVEPNANATYSVKKVDLVDIARIRGLGETNSNCFAVALAWPTQTVVTAAPAVARLEIAPTPTASTADAILCTYKAGAIDLSADTHVPNIPPAFEEALVLLARGKAKFYELDGDMSDWNMGLARLGKLQEIDGMHEPEVGYITGGAVRLRENSGNYRPFATSDIPDH